MPDISPVSYTHLVLVRYNGTKELYQVGQDTYIQPGGTGKFDFSAGDVKLYEYDKSADKFYEYKLRVMKSAQVSAMHFQIDDVPGYEDIFEYLHENKENETTGALVMVDSAGPVSYTHLSFGIISCKSAETAEASVLASFAVTPLALK